MNLFLYCILITFFYCFFFFLFLHLFQLLFLSSFLFFIFVLLIHSFLLFPFFPLSSFPSASLFFVSLRIPSFFYIVFLSSFFCSLSTSFIILFFFFPPCGPSLSVSLFTIQTLPASSPLPVRILLPLLFIYIFLLLDFCSFILSIPPPISSLQLQVASRHQFLHSWSYVLPYSAVVFDET